MNVFLTGASGYLGKTIGEALKKRGYQVLGLVRSAEGEVALEKCGIQPILGSIGDHDLLATSAQRADAVIHTAFSHDFADYRTAAEADRNTVNILGDALRQTNKPLIITSTSAILADTRSMEADEDFPFDQQSNRIIRGETERDIQQMSSKGIRGVALRLPLLVYGKSGSTIVPALIKGAERYGGANYFDGGKQKYSAIHVEDAAEFYIGALEKGTVKGVYNIATEVVSLRELSEAVGRLVGVPIRSISDDQARDEFGFLYDILKKSNVLSIERAQRDFESWVQPFTTISDDIENGSYRMLL